MVWGAFSEAMTAPDGPIMLNGACLDFEAGTLTRGANGISLRPRSFALLCYLARRPGKVVRKTELLEEVWHDVIVTEDSLTQAIRDIRLAIDDPAGECLRTFRGRGYSLNIQPAPTPLASTPERTIRLAILPFAVDAVSLDSRPLVSALVDDIAGGLSKFRTLTVLARGAAEALATVPDPRDIALRLKAQYLVQGTAQEGSDGLRLRLALIDGSEGTLVWSDSFDCSGERLLGVETDVTRRIIMHLNAGLEDEIDTRLLRQHTGSLTAYGHFARGRWAMQFFTTERLEEAHRHFSLAVEADPDFADAWAFLSWAELAVNDYRMATQEVLDRAYGYALRAVELAPNESHPVSNLGYVQNIFGEYEAAEANISKGLRLNPSSVDAMMDMATLHTFRGRPHEALNWLDRIEEIDPIRYQYICRTHRSEASYMVGKYAEAARVLSFVKPMPARRGLWMAAALAKAGNAEKAAPYLAAFSEAHPGLDPLAVAAHTYAYEHEADTVHLLDGLRLAMAANLQ
jgi:DNA-binding winged helix-turn-helix (wHTH) protein